MISRSASGGSVARITEGFRIVARRTFRLVNEAVNRVRIYVVRIVIRFQRIIREVARVTIFPVVAGFTRFRIHLGVTAVIVYPSPVVHFVLDTVAGDSRARTRRKYRITKNDEY